MQKRLILGPLLLLLASACSTTTPVANTLPRLAKYLDSGHEMNFNNEAVAAIFNQDRKELGENFHAAVLDFVKDNTKRHYWIGLFLTTKDYLGDNQPDPLFALLLFEQGLAISTDPGDYNRISLNVVAAITAQNLGFKPLALSHKATVENAIKKNNDLLGGFPALGEDDSKTYDAISVTEKP